MESPNKKPNFAVTVCFNEGLERWTAIDNDTQEIIGYGTDSMSAFMDYLDRSVKQDAPEEN